MAYCDIDGIKTKIDPDELIRLTDDDSRGIMDEDICDQMIAAADALINSYCARRYTVPFDPVPEMITALSIDISAYKLYARRNMAGETIRNDYKDAVSLLKDVSAKKADIDGAVSAGAEKSSDPVVITHADRIFSRDTLKGF